jgi:hypothetical protein
MFRTVPLSIIRSYSLYTQQWYMSYRFVDSFRAESGWNCNSILILLLDSCLQTCMTYTIAECTVNNSWWWTEELSETCRDSFQNKFEKSVHLVSFITRKAVWYVDQVRVSKFHVDRFVTDYKNPCSYCYQNTRATVRVFAFHILYLAQGWRAILCRKRQRILHTFTSESAKYCHHVAV